MLIETSEQIATLDWSKGDGLLPAIVQDHFDGRVLMQAWVNQPALVKTLETGRVTFFSRSRQALWTKGETSGNFLALEKIHADCDLDCLLITARPQGPTCHRGSDTCFDDSFRVAPGLAFLSSLEKLIAERDRERPEGSYTTQLLEEGIRRVAQKVGEEGVEVALAASSGDDDEVCNETADLLYHLCVMLRARNLPLAKIIATLSARHG